MRIEEASELKLLMTARVPVAKASETIGEVEARLYKEVSHLETINYIYVLSGGGHLIGVLSIKEVFRAKPNLKVQDLMKKVLVHVHPNTKKEKAAGIALEHNIKSVPVLDENEKFLGVVPSDVILSTLDKRYRRMMMKSAGIVVPKEYENVFEQKIGRIFLLRIPWIVLGLIGGVLGARIIGTYEEVLRHNLILAGFIPMIVYVSDAVGTQTQTLFVRDILLKPDLAIGKYMLKQFLIATLIGLVCGMLSYLFISLFSGQADLGVVVGLSTFLAISSSTIVAVSIPYLLTLLNQDPVEGSGPFATILQDLLSIVIYFMIATAIL